MDTLLLGFLALLALAAAAVQAPFELIAVAAAIALAIAGTRRAPLVHAFLPVPILALLVNVIGPVIAAANPRRWDAALAALDAQWFGALAAAWHGLLGRPAWLTDAASIAYAAYYVLPVATAAALWRKGRFAEFDRLVLVVTATLLASYVAYFAVPASGPGRDAAEGGAIAAGLRAFLEVVERNRLDAFPSGHTAASLAFLGAAWPMFPRARALFALVVAAIVFSTVYLSLHYVVDVVAGAALAGVVLASLATRAWPKRFSPAAS